MLGRGAEVTEQILGAAIAVHRALGNSSLRPRPPSLTGSVSSVPSVVHPSGVRAIGVDGPRHLQGSVPHIAQRCPHLGADLARLRVSLERP